MDKLLIIDGLNLLCQMFYGMPSRITGKDNKPIQGTLGFVGALIKIIKMVDPDYIAALFDGEHFNERSNLDANYKANRPDFSEIPEEESPFSQLSDVYSALDFLGIKHTEIDTYEADDAISSYAIKYQDELLITIVSLDSDFFQLINNNVSVLRYRGDRTIICDENYIRERFSISPRQYPDFKSLTGDTSDNIKGAEKIGVKTAAKLLNTFGTLENILNHYNEIEKPSIKASILRNLERLPLNLQLIKLDDRASLPFGLDEMKYCYNSITTTEVLKSIGLK